MQQNKKSKNGKVKNLAVFLVEMAVIETASEKPSTELSTSVSCLLNLPQNDAVRQASFLGSRIVHDRVCDTHLFTFTANRRPTPRPQYSTGGRLL